MPTPNDVTWARLRRPRSATAPRTSALEGPTFAMPSEIITTRRSACEAGAPAICDSARLRPENMFVEPAGTRPAIWRRISCRVCMSRRVGGTSECASSEKESRATMSPSLRLRTSVVAAARALSIFEPAIDPDVSTTRMTSMAGLFSGRASGTSTHTPRNVSRVLLERSSPSGGRRARSRRRGHRSRWRPRWPSREPRGRRWGSAGGPRSSRNQRPRPRKERPRTPCRAFACP